MQVTGDGNRNEHGVGRADALSGRGRSFGLFGKYRLFLFIVLQAFVCFGIGKAGITGALVGRVVDSEKRDGVPGVQVYLSIAGASATRGSGAVGVGTDSSGRFHIGNIHAGLYDVYFQRIGYKTVIVRQVTVLPDIRNEISVSMEPTLVELNPVEIRAQQPMIEKDQPMTAFSVSGNKISALPVSTIKEVLALQPSTTAEGNIRGGKITDVLYMVDGIPMQDVIGGGEGGTIPKSSIGGMTVMAGGFDAEYGNAISGVVNLVTRSASDHHWLLVRGEKDDLLPISVNDQVDGYGEAELSASGPIIAGKLSYLSSNAYTVSDTRWREDFQHFFGSPVMRQWNGLEKLEYNFSPETRLSVHGIFSDNRTHEYEFSWRYNLRGLPLLRRSSQRIGGAFSTAIAPRVYSNMSINRFSLRNRIGGDSPADLSLQPYEYDLFLRYIISGARNWWADQQQTIWTAKADISDDAIAMHYFKAGFEINRYDIASDLVKYEPQLTYFGKPDTSKPLLNYSNRYAYQPWSGSAYVQDKITFDASGSQASFGLRWDFLDPRAERPVVEFVPTAGAQYQQVVSGTTPARFKHQLSPRFAVSTSIDEKTFVFVNFGKYFQFPLFDYLYSGISPVELRQGAKNVLTGNPDLEPERTTQWEIGVKRAMSNTMVVSATYFRKNIENQVDTKTLVPSDSKFAGDFGYAQYVNNASANASGLEFVLGRENDDRISGSISYTYMQTEGTSEYADQTLNFSQWGFPVAPATFPLSWDQQHTLKLDLLARLPFGIEANVIVMYNSARPYTYYPSRDGFTPTDTTQLFIPNNRRMSDATVMNFKVQKKLTFKDTFVTSVSFYFDGRNILDAKNVRWIDASGRIGGELSDPGAYYDPRRGRIGMSAEF